MPVCRLSAAGFSIDPLNNPNGTLHYNVDDPEIVQKSQAYMPRRVWEGFRRRLQPGQETVGMHLDWFASKHLTGSPGDPLEQQADEVADAVVQGMSAEPLLDQFVKG